MNFRLTIVFLAASLSVAVNVPAQVLGGNAVFSFLKLPNTPQLTALGGVNITQPSDDVGLAFNNPALLKPSMHSQVNASFNNFYAGIRAYHLSAGFYNSQIKTSFLWGINYLDYGVASLTDPSGNVLGKFRPVDWVMSVGASRQYLEKWQYGATLKFINSSYGGYKASGLAADVGVLFKDTARLITASVLVKNMGVQLRKYPGGSTEELPFDLQAGITWRLSKAPLSFSLTAHRLHQFDISYNDTLFNNDIGFTGNGKGSAFEKLINHIVLAATVYLGDKVEIQAGYNFLKRRELGVGNLSNGMTGFSTGAGVFLGKIQVRYARSWYQGSSAFDQFGLSVNLNQFMRRNRAGSK